MNIATSLLSSQAAFACATISRSRFGLRDLTSTAQTVLRFAALCFAFGVWTGTVGQAQSTSSANTQQVNRSPSVDFRKHLTGLQDASTKPFQIRFPSKTFPVDAAGHPGKLTVQVVGLREYANQTLSLRYRLYRVDNGERIRKEQTDVELSGTGASEIIVLDDAAPLAAGVYEIRCSLLEPSDKIWSKIRGDKPEIASTQTPWMIHVARRSDASEPNSGQAVTNQEDAAPLQTRNLIAQPFSWERVGESKVIDPKSWDSPWSFAPWPGSSKNQSPDSVETDANIWQLPKLNPHQLYRVSIALNRLQQPKPSSANAPIETNASNTNASANPNAYETFLEFSAKPDFENVSRVEKLPTFTELNLSNQPDGETYRFDTLHYPVNEREHVRVKGRLRQNGFGIQSIDVARAVEPSSAGSVNETGQEAYNAFGIEFQEINWAQAITKDFAVRLPESNFSDSTKRLYRVWKATQRIVDYSRWLGFDELIVPLNSQGRVFVSHPNLVESGSHTSAGNRSNRFTDANTLLAMYRWLENSDLRLVAKLSSNFDLLQDANHPAESDVFPAFDHLVARQLQRCVSDWSSHIGITGKPLRIAVESGSTDQKRLEQLTQRCPGPKPVMILLTDRSHPLPNGPAMTAGASRITERSQPAIDRSAKRVVWSVTPETRYDFLTSITNQASHDIVLKIGSPAIFLPRRCLNVFGESRQIPDTRRPLIVNRLKTEKPSETSVDYLSVFTDRSGVTLVNRAPWMTEVTLQFDRPLPGSAPAVNWNLRGTDKQTTAVRPGTRSNECIIELNPLEIIGLDVFYGDTDSMHAALKSYRAKVVGGQVAMQAIKTHVGEVVGKIGNLAQPSDYKELRNGGFESEGQVGIVGWMHTQFPSDAVALDPIEAIEGKHSICMTTSEKSMGRTWLVSAPIPVPLSGRIAVSLATRSSIASSNPPKSDSLGSSATLRKNPFAQVTRIEASDAKSKKTPTQRVRVSLEGSRLGEPVRYVSEFDVPRDGQWSQRRIVLEADQLDAATIKEFRLTIDSLSPGKLWVDDVHLHDQFATQPERAGMQGQAFLAIQGLQRDQLHPAARLLQNRWSNHLLNADSKPWPSAFRAVHHGGVAHPDSDAARPADATSRRKDTRAGDGDTSMNRNTGNPVSSTVNNPLGKRTDLSDDSAGPSVNPSVNPSRDTQVPPIARSGESESPQASGNQKPQKPAQSPAKLEPRRPGIAERMKSWLPRPLRF